MVQKYYISVPKSYLGLDVENPAKIKAKSNPNPFKICGLGRSGRPLGRQVAPGKANLSTPHIDFSRNETDLGGDFYDPLGPSGGQNSPFLSKIKKIEKMVSKRRCRKNMKCERTFNAKMERFARQKKAFRLILPLKYKDFAGLEISCFLVVGMSLKSNGNRASRRSGDGFLRF